LLFPTRDKARRTPNLRGPQVAEFSEEGGAEGLGAEYAEAESAETAELDSAKTSEILAQAYCFG
jgi:hypothetical protein